MLRLIGDWFRASRTGTKLLLAVGGVALLAGCIPKSEPTAQASASGRQFQCGSGQSISIVFTEGTATLTASGAPVRLTQQSVASGVHYAGEGHDLRGKGPDLDWTDATGAVHHCHEAGSAQTEADLAPALAGTKWRLLQASTGSGPVSPPNIENYTLEFGADGALAMRLDCNRGSGRWSATPESPANGSLRISPLAMTRAMCPPGAIDTRLAADTGHMRSYAIAGNRLTTALADGGAYMWERLP